MPTFRKEDGLMEVLEPGFFEARIREYEARLIRDALQRAQGNQARAARILGLRPTTLASQLRRLGIEAREYKCHASPEWPRVP
jgi:transcriptional regulator with GAF, ATPase, and Fis domain